MSLFTRLILELIGLLFRSCYRAMELIRPTDYLYLCYAGGTWRLQMKLQLGENLSDLNRYYLRHVIVLNGQEYQKWITPLHEAIERGHLEQVKLLFSHGAVPTAQIKSLIDLESEAAIEKSSLACGCMQKWHLSPLQLNCELEQWNMSIGMSAIDLARKLAHDTPATHQKIFDWLRKQR